MVAAAIIRIRKLTWATYLGALSRINAILHDTSNIGPSPNLGPM